MRKFRTYLGIKTILHKHVNIIGIAFCIIVNLVYSNVIFHYNFTALKIYPRLHGTTCIGNRS